MDRIFLDNASTTKVAPEVRKQMDLVYERYFGNPSSIHTIGQEAKKIVDDGRRVVSNFVSCEPEEIIFTSGGSESDNLAIRGLVESRKWKVESGKKPHVITSAVEHHAVLHTVEDLEKEGLIEATYIKPDGEGIIAPDMVEKEIRENTILVSLIYVNNETGVVTPIREIGEMIRELNTKYSSLSPKSAKRIYFHTDAVQAAEYMKIDPEYLGVDLLTFTAHKLHGPKGIGALYTRKGTPIKSQITGGDQEFRHRAGTENVSGISGFAKALDLISIERAGTIHLDENFLSELIVTDEVLSLINLRDKLVEGIVERIPDAILNGSKLRRAPHIVNFSFMNAEGEAIILNLDFLGIAVSSGSACTSRSLDPSHVLSAMGIPPEKAHGSTRISLSRYTTEEEIDKLLEVLPPVIEKLRKMSPFNNNQ